MIGELFWNSSLEELKQGFIKEEENYICLFCGKKTETGVIYADGHVFYDAQKYMSVHIEKEHGSVFEYLIGMDKRLTGLSDHQRSLLMLFYQRKSDGEIQKTLGIGSSSTIRNHRFVLREKERQAKVFLVLMELLKDSAGKTSKYILPHTSARMVDNRYRTTEDEEEKTLKKYFPEGPEGPLKTFSIKEKNKIVVLRHIIKRFELKRIYTEKEVNGILKDINEDFVTIRRYLIEYGFMERKADGSQYWVSQGQAEDKDMDNKKELIRQYKEMKNECGVYQIRNNRNGKILVCTTPNFKTINGKIFQLNMGVHKNSQLQKEWNEYGEEAFEFLVLEALKEKEDGVLDKKDELKKLEKKWLDKLKPYGDKGYNKESLK